MNKFKKIGITILAIIGISTILSGPVFANAPGMGADVLRTVQMTTTFVCPGGTACNETITVNARQVVSFRHRTGTRTNIRIESGSNRGAIGYINNSDLGNWRW